VNSATTGEVGDREPTTEGGYEFWQKDGGCQVERPRVQFAQGAEWSTLLLSTRPGVTWFYVMTENDLPLTRVFCRFPRLNFWSFARLNFCSRQCQYKGVRRIYHNIPSGGSSAEWSLEGPHRTLISARRSFLEQANGEICAEWTSLVNVQLAMAVSGFDYQTWSVA
jgi:hypothetical protein